MTAHKDTFSFVGNYRALFLVIFVLAHVLMATQVYLLSRDIVYGDGSAEQLLIAPRYPLMRVPGTSITDRYDAAGRLCADFAGIYFPSLNISDLDKEFSVATTTDPWSRPLKYPPLLALVFATTFCRLPYGPASLLHLVLQITLFLASLKFAFGVLKLNKFFLPSLLLIDTCLFLTPVGLAWLERGQFTLYVALSFLWLMLTLITGTKRYAVIAAVFAFIKWTSFPFFFVALSVFMVISKDLSTFKKRLFLSFLVVGTTLIMFCALPRYIPGSLNAIMEQELTFRPMGLSLARILPRFAVKGLPFILIAVGFAVGFAQEKQVPHLIPFFSGSAVVLLTYPTFAFDYSVPALLAFVPFIIYWKTLPYVQNNIGTLVQIAFALFLILASYAVRMFPYSETSVILLYVFMGVALTLTSFLNIPKHVRVPPTS